MAENGITRSIRERDELRAEVAKLTEALARSHQANVALQVEVHRLQQELDAQGKRHADRVANKILRTERKVSDE